MARAAPDGDHARCRMCGGMLLGRVVSLNRTGFCVLKVWAKKSFLRGRLRAGAGILGSCVCAGTRWWTGGLQSACFASEVCGRASDGFERFGEVKID